MIHNFSINKDEVLVQGLHEWPGYSHFVNPEEIVSVVGSFINLVSGYSWYLEITENQFPEIPVFFAQLPLMTTRDGIKSLGHVTLMLTPDHRIKILSNGYFGCTKKMGIICRRYDNPLSFETIKKLGLRKIQFPNILSSRISFSPLNLSGSFYIDEKVITYSFAKAQVPVVSDDDLPLYIGCNDLLKTTLDLENRLKGTVKKTAPPSYPPTVKCRINFIEHEYQGELKWVEKLDYLTVGKTYNVLNKINFPGHWQIEDDAGNHYCYSKTLFV